MDMRGRIRLRLELMGLSVRGASLEAGLGETTLRNYLKDMTRSMTEHTIQKLAPVLGVTAQWLMSGTDPHPDAKIISIINSVPAERREQAIRILQTFADEAGGSA